MKKEFFFFVDAYLNTEKKPRAKKLPFHYESSARKSNLWVQSGGGSVPVCAKGVEHKKLNQTAALLSFGWGFGVQLDH